MIGYLEWEAQMVTELVLEGKMTRLNLGGVF